MTVGMFFITGVTVGLEFKDLTDGRTAFEILLGPIGIALIW